MKQKKYSNDSAEQGYQLHIKALDLFETGQITQATEIVQQLLRLDPKDPHVDHIKGFLISELGLQDEAIPLLQRAAWKPRRPNPVVALRATHHAIEMTVSKFSH
jgi:Flp pilus assembly protein TadD